MVVSLADRLEKGAWGAIRHAIGAVLRNALVGLVIGVVLVEAAGAALDKPAGFSFPGGVFVQVASVAFGLALAFAFAMTTALVETVRGLVDAVRTLETDASKAVGAGLGDAGHVVQSVERKL